MYAHINMIMITNIPPPSYITHTPLIENMKNTVGGPNNTLNPCIGGRRGDYIDISQKYCFFQRKYCFFKKNIDSQNVPHMCTQ